MKKLKIVKGFYSHLYLIYYNEPNTCFLMKYILLTFIFSFIALPSSVLAFDPNNIISDAELLDTQSLTVQEIEEILERGTLSTYTAEDINGQQRSAAQIIWDTAQRVQISPKFLITLLQKEQSLIEDTTPDQSQFDWATGYGVCDTCNHRTEHIQRWRGFAKTTQFCCSSVR